MYTCCYYITVEFEWFSSGLRCICWAFSAFAEMSMGGEARTCDSQSHNFKGLCLSDSNCANVCKNEGFPGGKCHGFRQRCFCEKPC